MTRAAGVGVRVVVIVIATGVFGYCYGREAWHVARQVYRDFVSG